MNFYTTLISLSVLVTLIAIRSIITYRRHPLKRYPGPFLAGLTRWYRAYYEIIRDGGFLEHLEGLHEKYGPIVRVSPTELHFSDPSAYDEVYMNLNTIKDPSMYQMFGLDRSSFGTTDPHFAKIRRSVLLPLFSYRNIMDLSPMLQEQVDKLVQNMLLNQQQEPTIDMSMAIRSATTDIITTYCFGSSIGALDAPGFRDSTVIGFHKFIQMTWLVRYFPALLTLSNNLPSWLVNLSSPLRSVTSFKNQTAHHLDEILKNPDQLESAAHKTLYHYLLTPQPEKGVYTVPDRQSLLDEAQLLIAAGADTVGAIVNTGVFYVLYDPAVHAQLAQELEEVWPDVDMPTPGYDKLTKLPYLSAVVKESLRLSPSAPNQLARVITADSMQVFGETVPFGCVVSCGITFVHRNPELFPEPTKFKPERWLDAGRAANLEKYLVPFSRGPRNCLGQNLAYFELYIIMATLFRRLNMTLVGTTEEDMKFRQYVTPIYRGRPVTVSVIAK